LRSHCLPAAEPPLLASRLRFAGGPLPFEEFLAFQSHCGVLGTTMLVAPILLAANGMYRPRRSISWPDHVYVIFTSISAATAIAIVVSAIMWHDVSSSRLMVALAWLLATVLVTLGRATVYSFQSSLRRRGLG